MDILLNVFKYLLQILTERDAEIEALKKDKTIKRRRHHKRGRGYYRRRTQRLRKREYYL